MHTNGGHRCAITGGKPGEGLVPCSCVTCTAWMQSFQPRKITFPLRPKKRDAGEPFKKVLESEPIHGAPHDGNDEV